jgi:hypothetical protein
MPPALFALVIIGIRILYFVQARLWSSCFKLSTIAGMTDAYNHTQLFFYLVEFLKTFSLDCP